MNSWIDKAKEMNCKYGEWFALEIVKEMLSVRFDNPKEKREHFEYWMKIETTLLELNK